MSNVFVIIKMCYVHNQWYDISCATLYICSVCYCNEWKTEEYHECANTGTLQMTRFMIAAVSYFTLSLGLRQFQATWYMLVWVCTSILKYLGLPSQICNWWVVILQGNILFISNRHIPVKYEMWFGILSWMIKFLISVFPLDSKIVIVLQALYVI